MEKNFPYSNKEQEKLIEEVRRLMEERGRKSLEMTRKAVLEEKIECKEAREALHYFITEYWHDLARPTLLSVCCEVVGGDPNATIPFAVPLSLISGALDLHDDIIDQSKTKHGRSTVYGKYGKEIALLVADALLFKGFTLLHKAYTQISKEKSTKIMDIIKNMFYELGDAEAMELKLRGRLDIAPEEYLRIIEKKAADVEAHARIGAMIGNGKQEKLGKYGRILGMLIIIRDDIVDLFDAKEAIHRIKKEHLPLPLVYALNRKKNVDALKKILAEKDIPEMVLEKLLRNIKQTGGFRDIENLIRELAEQAYYEIGTLNSSHKLINLVGLLQSESLQQIDR